MKIKVLTKDPETTNGVIYDIVETLYDSGLRGKALLEIAVLEYNKYAETFVDLGETNAWILDTETGEIELQPNSFFRKLRDEMSPEKSELWAGDKRKGIAGEVGACEKRRVRRAKQCTQCPGCACYGTLHEKPHNKGCRLHPTAPPVAELAKPCRCDFCAAARVGSLKDNERFRK